jgi:hypothetical protein
MAFRADQQGIQANEESLTTVHCTNLTIRHKSVGTHWSGCVIRTHDPFIRIDRSQNHAHFNPYNHRSDNSYRA